MSPALPEALLALRDEFVRELPRRVGELVRALEALRAAPGDGAAHQAARSLAHQLQGTAGSYGLPGVGEAAGMVTSALDQPGGEACAAAADLAGRLFAALRELPEGVPLEAAVRPVHAGPRLLVFSTDAVLLRTLAELGRTQLWEVVVTGSPKEALEAAARTRPDAALLDAEAGEACAALELASALRALSRGTMPLALADVGPEGSKVAARVQAARAGVALCVDKPVEAPQLAMQLEALFSEARALREPVRVLVLRDSAQALARTVALLCDNGLHAGPVHDPAALLEAFEQERPDAVVLDEVALGFDGADACRAIRSALRWRDLPIIIVADPTTSTEEARLSAAEAGADGYLPEPLSGPVLAARVRALVLRARVQRDRADTDPLTGLLLRRPFLDRLAARLALARRSRVPLAVCLLDLDGFKEINTRLGHLGADRLLAAFGRLLLGTFRLEDLRCRWGGDEFALAFPGQSAELALSLLRRMEPRGGTGSEADRALAPVPFSAGVAAFPADGSEAAELLRVADQRLFHAKAAGRGRAFAT